MNSKKSPRIDEVVEFLLQKIADLENPLLYKVGDKVRAKGKGSLEQLMSYEGDVISASYEYRKADTSIADFYSTVRINKFKIYNTRSKTVHEITDNNFNIDLISK